MRFQKTIAVNPKPSKLKQEGVQGRICDSRRRRVPRSASIEGGTRQRPRRGRAVARLYSPPSQNLTSSVTLFPHSTVKNLPTCRADGSSRKVIMVERRNAIGTVSLVQGKAGVGVSLGSTAEGEIFVTGLAPGGPAEICKKVSSICLVSPHLVLTHTLTHTCFPRGYQVSHGFSQTQNQP